jgi:hypothetical protein
MNIDRPRISFNETWPLDIEGRTQTKGTSKHGAEENIWTEDG